MAQAKPVATTGQRPWHHQGHRKALALVRPLGLAAAIASAAVLLSHATGFRPGFRATPTGPGTSPMTAATLLLLGLGLARHHLLRASRQEMVLVFCALAIAILRLAEIAFGFSILPGTVMRPDPHAPAISFGWNSALGVALCALAILSLRHMRTSLTQALAALSLAVPMVALVGYSYGLHTFHGQSSIYTATILLLLALGAALATARSGMVRVLFGSFTTGRLARMQLIGAFIIPYVTGYLLLRAENAEPTSIIGLGVISTAALIAALLSISLQALDRMDQRRRQAERKTYFAATHDPLTGLANPRMFTEIAEMDLRRMTRHAMTVCLIMIDIDHFKTINDGFGHTTGDRVLQRVANLIARNVRSGDLAARLGGEEFAVFLPDTTLAEAEILAERLRKTIAAADFSELFGTSRTVTVSVGLGRQPPDHDDLSALLRMADAALYVAKAKGRNRVEPAEPVSAAR